MAKGKTVFILIIALMLAAGAAWMANQWIQLQVMPVSANTDQAPMSPVVVAARDIPLGYKITGAHVKVVTWPSDGAPADGFATIEEVEGKTPNQQIYAGEPILKQRVAELSKGSTLSSLIELSKRAITVRVNDIIGVAGFILPGNRVDVLATRGGKKGANTTTTLQNMKVLAVDQTTGDKDKPVLVRAVTLEATPEEAEILVEARSEGSIQLALRNSLDVAMVEKPKAPAPKPVKVSRRKAAQHVVTVIRGVEQKQQTFR